MEELIHRPHARALINSLRAIGYSFDTALADIVDNSIAAGCHVVQITMRPGASPCVAILDDGCGMTRSVLIEAMRHGGAGPTADRGRKDLGRYGLGLKTASLSQCRRLTVVSRTSGQTHGARWDLDDIEDRDDWVLTLPDPSSLRSCRVSNSCSPSQAVPSSSGRTSTEPSLGNVFQHAPLKGCWTKAETTCR